MTPESFLNGKVTLFAGDMLAVMPTLEENSIDSCVCDPPYGLQFMGRDWDKLWRNSTNADVAYVERTNGQLTSRARKLPDYAATNPQQMQVWHETWAREVYRVLKPGGFLVAFGGTRTYHRMACAIEDAGFEIRDCIMWVYGSGFPKSHDVSKAIDRRGGANVGWFGPWLKKWRAERGIAQNDIAALFLSKTGGKTGCVANWELGFNLPTPEQFNLICKTFDLPFESIEEAEREVIETRFDGGGRNVAILGTEPQEYEVTAPATPAAAQWAGYGTALKPAVEPIVLARKPLSEPTVAANVLRWGTGAINVDGCRVGIDESERAIIDSRSGSGESTPGWGHIGNRDKEQKFQSHNAGRWPANLVLSVPEDEFELRPFVTAEEKRELFRWLYENT